MKSWNTRLIRSILILNFILLLLLLGPGSSHELDLKLRRLGVENTIVWSIQFCFVAGTILATALFILAYTSKLKLQAVATPTRLDWILLLAWWFVILVLCLFAFMMGMGG